MLVLWSFVHRRLFCSKGNVENKILVPKLPKNCARCARCGHLVNGPYCQGCTLLREKLEEDLVTYFQNFQNTFKSSDDSTNVVNAPREPFVFKQDHGVNPPHIDECWCECGDALDGIYCQQCICKSCGKAANAQYWKIAACCDDDDNYNSAITPAVSTEEPDNSLIMGDEHLNTIPATKSDDVIKSSVEDLVPIPSESKVEEIEDDNMREKLLNVYLLIANIEALKDNPTPSSEFLTKSSSTSLKSFLEETNTFHNSLPEFENFCFDLEEISSGSTTTHSDISLSEYDSFTFDLSNDQFPPTDRSDFANEEFIGELTHIIAPPEYDRFYFWNFPDLGELISILNSEIHENPYTTHVNLPVEDAHSPLLTYVVCIFLAYLTYPIIPPYLHSFGNEDTIFDPGITINHFCLFKPGLSHRCGIFKKFNTHRSHLNEVRWRCCFPLAPPWTNEFGVESSL
uniref:Pre-mRNA splicing Prp18-interacting factor n=1 Tax=Tanacetum cinerariifolium TaxID=118510 RepID=A0A6L2L6G8_TANCI|nr:hypothetical protein [Tanacetum cinerariifolium]